MSDQPNNEEPTAVITIKVDGEKLDITCEFSPAAKTTGPVHPAHNAAVAMLRYFSEAQRRQPVEGHECENCGEPATTADSEGVPLCDDCAASLDDEEGE